MSSLSLNDFKKKWNLKVKYSLFKTKIYLKDELVGEFDERTRPYFYWVSTEISKEFTDDFLLVFAERYTID